jgi:hypothetical protein
MTGIWWFARFISQRPASAMWVLSDQLDSSLQFIEQRLLSADRWL